MGRPYAPRVPPGLPVPGPRRRLGAYSHVLQGRTVLVVEDDPAVWRALEDVLVRAGAIVLTPDYRACEILAARHPPDAVVLDVHAAAEVPAGLAAEGHLRDGP